MQILGVTFKINQNKHFTINFEKKFEKKSVTKCSNFDNQVADRILKVFFNNKVSMLLLPRAEGKAMSINMAFQVLTTELDSIKKTVNNYANSYQKNAEPLWINCKQCLMQICEDKQLAAEDQGKAKTLKTRLLALQAPYNNNIKDPLRQIEPIIRYKMKKENENHYR